MNCAGCRSERATKVTGAGRERLPPGWHRRGDVEVFCGECWRGRYLLRAVTIPVAGPVDREWPELREALARCWSDSTAVANWCMTELAKRDHVRHPSDEKCPPMGRIYLYPDARKRFPGLSTNALVSLLNSTERRYRKARFAVQWTHAASLPLFRYPVPYPMHNRTWRARRGDGGEALIDATFAGERWTLRLRGGHEFRRQFGAFDKIAKGQAVQGELVFYRVRASSGDHRPGVEDRTAGGGPRIAFRVMAKMVAWLPRPATAERQEDRLLVLRTREDCFWLAEIEGLPPWILNGDHVRRWVAEHAVRRQRLAEDLKHEKRWPKPQRLAMLAKLDACCRKQHDRLKTWIGQCAASVAGYARRQHVTRVSYDDSARGYVDSFPWSQLETALASKLDEYGIVLEHEEVKSDVAGGDSSAEVISDVRESLDVS